MARSGNPFSKRNDGMARKNPFSRGGGTDAEGRLNSAVGKAEETGDKGLIGAVRGIADKVGLDSAGNAVLKGLEIADYGRAAVMAGGIELMDAISAATGGEGTIEDTDKVQQTGVSWDDFVTNLKSHVGMGDVLEADPRTRDLPLNVKRGLGFLGDVGADPLTYLSGGTSQVARGGGKTLGRRTLVSTRDAAETLVRAGDEQAAETVLRGGSTAAVPRSTLAKVGLERGVYLARRYRIKALDGVHDAMSRARGAARTKAARLIESRVSPETWRRFETVPGVARIRNSPELQRQGVANVRALEWALSWRDAGINARNLKAEYGSRLDDLFRQFRDVDKDSLRQGLEGAQVDNPAVGPMRSFFDDIHSAVNEVTGSRIPRLDDYLSHMLTEEAREGLGKAAGGRDGLPGFVKKRKLDKSIDTANQDFRDFLAEAAEHVKARFGGVIPDLFKTDPWEIAVTYLNQVERFVRFKAFEKGITDAGLLTYFNKKAVKGALAANKQLARGVRKLTTKAVRAGERREQQLERAAKTRAEIAVDLFRPRRLKAADDAGRISADLGADADELAVQLDDIETELTRLANEAGGLQQRLAEALPRDPAEVIEAEQGKVARSEAAQAKAAAARQAAEVELADLEATPTANVDEARAAVDQAASELEGRVAEAQGMRKQLAAARARAKRAKPTELSVKARKDQALAALRQAGAPDTAVREAEATLKKAGPDVQLLAALEERFGLSKVDDPASSQLADLETQASEVRAARDEAKATHKGLVQALAEIEAAGPPPEDLAERITAAKRRVASAGAREARSANAIERRLKVIEKHQAILETEYAVKGDIRPLVDENKARIRELKAERKGVARDLRATEKAELVFRERAERLYEAAGQETDPRLAMVARFEAQAAQAEASMLNYRLSAAVVATAKVHVSARDLELLEAAMTDQLQQVNKHARLWADPDTAKALLDLREMLRPEQTGKLLRLHDTVMSRWKAYSLLSPGYHFRNGYSAMFMNAVAGYDGGARGYMRFGRLWAKAERDGIDAALKGVKDASYADAFRETWEMRGSLFGENGIRDIADAYLDQGTRKGLAGDRLTVRGRNLDPTALDNVALSANMRTAGKVERLVRGPLFIDGLMKGLTREQAYERVIRFHFDYSEGIGQFEKRVMRRVVPFYTWTRLNFPLQLEYMVRNPGVYTRYTHARRNLEQGTDDERYVPSYLEELGGIRLPASAGGDRMYAAPDLPFLRLGQTFDVDQLAAQVTPLIKTPLELDRGERFFNDIPFKKGYQEVPAAWVGVGELLDLAGGKFGLPKVEKIDGRYFFTNEGELYKVEQAMPLLGRMRRLMPSDESGQEKALTSWLSFGLGLTTVANGPKQQESEMRRREEEIKSLVDAWQRRQAIKEGTA